MKNFVPYIHFPEVDNHKIKMQNKVGALIFLMFLCLASCHGTDDDSSNSCTGECNVFTGRIYTEDNVGIPNVQVTLSYSLNQIGADYQRIIAKSKTDADGNYFIEGYIKDSEFNAGFFHLTVDESKIENALSNQFFKPSELYNEVAPRINQYLIPGLENRSQVIDIDYKIPYKTSITVNLNDFIPTSPDDMFGIGNRINYGFESDANRFLTKVTETGFAFSTGVTTSFAMPGVYGENHFSVFRFKDGAGQYTSDTIIIDNPNTAAPLNYSF